MAEAKEHKPAAKKAPAKTAAPKAAPAKAAAPKKQISGKSVTVRQIRSANRKPETVAATLRGLGLGKIRRERTLEDTPAVRGMIRKVSNLVEVVEQK